MNIAILGAGNVGGTLGKAWARRGHRIAFGVKNPAAERYRTLADEAGTAAEVAGPADVVSRAEVVLLAVPWPEVNVALQSSGPFRDQVLIDATNPLTDDGSGLLLGHTTSAGEEVAKIAKGAKVVKAFNTIGARHMAEPRFAGTPASMFLCGDDAEAKRLTAGLAAELGFDPVDVGPLSQARLLEPMAMLWISMAYAYGHGPDIAFHLLRK